jgi:hypothetical protein
MEKDMKKKRSKKTKLLPVCKEKRSVELEKFVEGIKTRSCSKSNKVTVKDCRNVCKKLSKKLMFNKTVSKDKKKTDDTVSKDERKIDCKVSKQRGDVFFRLMILYVFPSFWNKNITYFTMLEVFV